MTYNPNLREIRDNCLLSQRALDRPDICARVFHLKEVSAHVHVVEFQKRGLPHAHILVTLKMVTNCLPSMISINTFLLKFLILRPIQNIRYNSITLWLIL